MFLDSFQSNISRHFIRRLITTPSPATTTIVRFPVPIIIWYSVLISYLQPVSLNPHLLTVTPAGRRPNKTRADRPPSSLPFLPQSLLEHVRFAVLPRRGILGVDARGIPSPLRPFGRLPRLFLLFRLVLPLPLPLSSRLPIFS